MADPQLENGYTRMANETLEALAKIRISGEARQVLDVIIRKTYGFNKKWDAIPLSQFVRATGLSRQSVVRAINKLESMAIIKKATGNITKYMFNKNFEKWEPVSKKRRGVAKLSTASRKIETGGVAKLSTKRSQKSDTQKTIQKKENKKQSSKENCEPSGSLVESSDHPKIIKYWTDQYTKKFNIKYDFQKGKDGLLIKKLLSTFGYDMLSEMVIAFFETDDEWVKNKGGFTIGVFKTQANKIAQKLTTPEFLKGLSDTSRHNYNVLSDWIKTSEVKND